MNKIMDIIALIGMYIFVRHLISQVVQSCFNYFCNTDENREFIKLE